MQVTSTAPVRAPTDVVVPPRRRETTAAIIGLAAVLLAGLVFVAITTLPGSDGTAPDSTSSLACPGPQPGGVAQVEPQAGPALGLTHQPVAARLCGFAADLGAGSGILRQGADRIARQIYDLPVVFEGSDMVCASHFAESWVPRVVLLAWADGSTLTVPASAPCDDGSGFQVGGRNRGSYVDVRNVLASFSALLAAQEGVSAPRESFVLRCSDRPRSPVTGVPTLTSGVLCETLRAPIRRHLAEVPLSAEDLAVLASDIRRRVERFGSVGEPCRGTDPAFALVARDSTGLTYRLSTCGSYPTDRGRLQEAPGARGRDVLARLGSSPE